MIMIDITVAMIEFFRLVVENEDLYGRDYRLIDENHDRDYPKAYTCQLSRIQHRSPGLPGIKSSYELPYSSKIRIFFDS